MQRLAGQVALVTGGGTGIGAAIAVRLAVEGATVAVNGHVDGSADGVVEQIRNAGGRAISVVADVSAPSEVASMVQRCVDELGALTIAVNNAGIQEETPFLDIDFDSWRAQLAVDLDGVFLVAQAAARHQAAHGGGVIVNITSVHEHTPRPGYAAYCAAKAGAGMLTKCLGRELAPHGIRVVGVAPGAIATAMNAEVTGDDEERERVEAGIPAGRFGTPEEVAGLVAYLCSPEAAYMSGTTVVMDGALEQEVSES